MMKEDYKGMAALDVAKTTKWKRSPHTHFRSFSDARAFVHALKLLNSVEYHRWARGSEGLEDIPVNPNLVYRDCGWQGWIDWVGQSYRPSNKPFVTYELAKTFVRALELPTKGAFDKWVASTERAAQIPARPDLTYRNAGWHDWQDFLGYSGRKRGHRQGRFLPFQEARAWVHAQKFTTSGDLRRMQAQGLLPDDIPTSPSLVYQQSGWISWQDWVGCPPRRERWRPFKEARELARSLKLRDAPTYKKWAMTSERPTDVPSAPHHVYRDQGWTDWYDWLGHPKTQTPRQYLSLDEARAFMRGQNLVGSSGWAAWCREGFKPDNISSNPALFYRHHGWQDWQDFLGAAKQLRRGRLKYDAWRSFPEARRFAQSLRLWSIKAWRDWCESSAWPSDIPKHPDYAYKNEGWAGWRDFLGKIPSEGTAGRSVPSKKWRPFEDARRYARALMLTSAEDWKHWADGPGRPEDIPKTPSHVYRAQGWVGMSDWLGLEMRPGR